MGKNILFIIFFVGLSIKAKANPGHLEQFKKFEKGCASGHAQDCGNLGALYAQGRLGSAPDFVKAYELYSKACLAGASERCVRAGYFALRGKGTVASKNDSEKLLNKGCELKDGESCNSLALLKIDASATDSGTLASVPTADKKEVYALLNKACGLGSEQGCKNIVKALSNKIEVQLTVEAKAEMEKLCNKGIVEGCPRLYIKKK